MISSVNKLNDLDIFAFLRLQSTFADKETPSGIIGVQCNGVNKAILIDCDINYDE